MAEIRTFETGATRDADTEKLDYEGFLSPLVSERYAQYLHKHRRQTDGRLRDSDNWQKAFGDDHFKVCMKSGWRHFHAWWTAHRGWPTKEDIEDSICGLIFNATAYLHERLRRKLVSS